MMKFFRSLWSWLTDDNWQRRHFVLSPFGIAATTLLVTHFHDAGNRPVIAHFDQMAALASISAVIYGMAAVLTETLGGKTVFYILSQVGKAMRAVKAEHEAEFIERYRTDPEYRAMVQAGVKPSGRARRRRRPLAEPTGGEER